jgi:hypothetical protein
MRPSMDPEKTPANQLVSGTSLSPVGVAFAISKECSASRASPARLDSGRWATIILREQIMTHHGHHPSVPISI